MKTTWRIGVRAPWMTRGFRSGGLPTVATTRPGSTELRPTIRTATSAAAARTLQAMRCTPGDATGRGGRAWSVEVQVRAQEHDRPQHHGQDGRRDGADGVEVAQVVVRVRDEHADDEKRDHEDAADEAEHRTSSRRRREMSRAGRRRPLRAAGPFAPRWARWRP